MTALLLLSLVSCIVSWLWYKVKYRKGLTALELKMKVGLDANKQKNLLLHSSIKDVFKPLLGNIHARFQYNDVELSERVNLHAKQSNKFISLVPGASAVAKLSLPDIKEYRFQSAYLFFEDLFRFFSFPAKSKLSQQIVNLPLTLDKETHTIFPEKSREESVRIEKLRRVDGELLRYKKFEASDDVRRIVWKVFAKNRELVVRQAEIFNPYASHIDIYASFYSALDGSSLFHDHLAELLNFYKNILWTWTDEMKSAEYQVNLHLDQKVKIPSSDLDSDAYKISLSSWQTDLPTRDFVKKGKGQMIFLHSLIPHKEIEQVLSKIDTGTKVCYISLGRAFQSRLSTAWFRLIFLRPKEDKLSKISNTWGLHPLKSLMQKNDEKNIHTLKEEIQALTIIE